MREIKVDFVDFWANFDKENNYFYNLLSKKYTIKIDENPDLLFYSCFGEVYLRYNCKRIFYTGENMRPDFLACDFAFTFDYNKNKKHFRLPLYSLYIDHHNMLDKLKTITSREEAREIWKKKTKFCCMVVSNPNCKKRLDFFENLSKVRQVDSGGSVLNNVGGRVPNKSEFIKDYKFVISFENIAQDGYTTEKIMEPIFDDCIPIYWGNKAIDKDFNSKRFIDYNKFNSEESLINRLLEIEQNEELAIDILMEQTFNKDKITHEEEHQKVLEIINNIIETDTKPIAIQRLRYLHKSKLVIGKLKTKFIKILK